MTAHVLEGLVSRAAGGLLAKHHDILATVAVVTPQTHFVTTFGKASEIDAAGADLIYEIGSVTKVFTAALLADLVRAGELDLNDPVQRFLPPGVRVPSPGGASMTLEHLATHTAGLPRYPTNVKHTGAADPFSTYSVDQLHEFLCGHVGRGTPPFRFQYSNLGAGLLGHVLAEHLGTDYAQAIRGRICAPLGMIETVVTLSAEQERRRVPGYSARGRAAPPVELQALAGAGALRSTARDMVRFLTAQLGLTDDPLAETFAMCQEPRELKGKRLPIGLGWMIVRPNGRTVAWHNGATAGFRSCIGVMKKPGVGVGVLMNRGPSFLSALGIGPPPAERVAFRLLKALASAA
jgi:serine-type D-Ala-D-Ala carboxypeptidase/endopeptidase